jgi:hypothetical protein
MRTFRIAILCSAFALGAAAQGADRLSDGDIKTLIERVNQARDRFEDQLDGKVKDGVQRSPSGEIKVSSALDDLQEDVSKLKSRFTEAYAASTEVAALLRRGNTFDALVKAQPAGTKGTNEWERLAVELRRLASAYNTAFPLPEGAAVRRINDGEAAAAATAIVKQGDVIKDAIGDDKTLAKADKQALESAVNTLVKQAKTVASRLNDHKPATADARALRKAAAALTAGGRQLPASVLTAIGGLAAPLATLDQAFGGLS